ncbi:MAG: small multi-drug export protein [Thermoplasmatota archaeon]|nr:small multi-drug export protein [Halobacteriales archaeon]
MVGTLTAAFVVLGVSGLPVIEMRLAVGLGIFVFHLPPVVVFLLTVAGNLFVMAPVWFLFPHAERGLRRWVAMGRWLDWLYARTRRDTANRRAVESVGLFAVVALTAVPFPLPGSGLYTALVATYIFGLPLRKAFPWLAAGIVVATALLTLEAWAGGAAFRHFFPVD